MKTSRLEFSVKECRVLGLPRKVHETVPVNIRAVRAKVEGQNKSGGIKDS